MRLLSRSAKLITRSTGASVLVLTCIDPRFTEFLSWFLTSQVWSNYDLFALAGSSMGYIQSQAGVQNPDGAASSGPGPKWPIAVDDLSGINWGAVFHDHVRLAVSLHNISEVWVFDHLDCSAYKHYQFNAAVDDDQTPHIANLRTMRTLLSNNSEFQDLKFKGFVMDLSGNINFAIGYDETTGIQLDDEIKKHNRTALIVYLLLVFSIFTIVAISIRYR